MIVATLYGPSGAGKSTLFRLLTGVAVPASFRRPTSFATVVATPSRLGDGGRLAGHFPDLRLEPLRESDVDCLGRKESSGKAFHIPSAVLDGSGGPLLVLADVPDFDTVHQANWATSRAMLERAEVVVFVTHKEGYATARAVEELARCCGLAATLVYVLTKVERPEAAREIWQDLCGPVAAVGYQPEFQQRRADGMTRHEFLCGCPVYYSEYAGEPTLDQVHPLEDGQPPLLDSLKGLGEDVVLRGLAEASWRAAQSCRAVLVRARNRRTDLEGNLARAEALVQERAARVAGSEFPSGRWMEIVVEEARTSQRTLVRVVTTPLRWPGPLRRWIGDGGTAIRNLFRPGPVRNRQELEGERLTEAVKDLIDAWRKEFEDEATTAGMLGGERCGRTRAEFAKQSPPTPERGWEEAVRKAVRGWAERNPKLSRSLPVVSDLLTAGGFGLLVLDLATTGGLFGSAVVLGSLGVAGAAAAGVGVAGELLNWARGWKLEHVALDADRSWRAQRTDELATHLRTHLADPLFQPWRDSQEQLDLSLIESCEAACSELEDLRRTV